MPQSALARAAQAQVQWLAELSQFASRHADARVLLAHAHDVLRASYAAERVQLGNYATQPPLFASDDAQGAVVPDEVSVLVDANPRPACAAFPADASSITGHGLVLGLEDGGRVGWCTPAPRELLAIDVQFLRSLAFLIGSTFERRALEWDRRTQVRRLLRAKQQWESAVDAMAQGIVLLDGRARVLRVNRALEDWGFARLRRVRGHRLDDLLFSLEPACAPAINEALATLPGGGRSEFEADCPLLSKRLRLCLHRLPGEAEPDAPCAVLVIDDVTRQHEAEEVLAEYSERLELTVHTHRELADLDVRVARPAEDRRSDDDARTVADKGYQQVLEHSLAGSAMVRRGTVTWCNASFAAVFHTPRERLYGLRVEELVADAANATWPHADGGPCLLHLLRQGEAPAVVRSATTMTDTAEGPAFLWSVIDLSNEMRMEDELKRSRTELQRLSETLLKTQERERKRVAMELHDGIGQSLSAIRIGIQARRTGEDPLCRHCPTLTDTGERIHNAIEEVRRIALDLRPPMLDDLGLLPTLDWFCREFQLTHSRPLLFRDTGVSEADIPKRLRIVIFRIVQEAVRNVVDHAEASEVAVTLAAEGDGLFLMVRDNGMGFDPGALPHTGRYGLGLTSMRERAEMSGGEFELRSVRRVGTTVQVRWPAED